MMVTLTSALTNEAVVSANAREKPNVIVFLADDQGYGDFSFTGNQDLATPNIDSLARDGAVFSNFYVCPVCSPTRAEFLTGRYAARCGVFSTSAGGERIDLNETILAEAFKASGYATAAFGKWHNGTQAPYHPNTRGFDEFYGFCSGHWGQYFDPILEHNGKLVRGEGYCVDDFTDRAIQFIEANQDKPFFVYLPYNIPHSPMQVPEQYWRQFKDKKLSGLPPIPRQTQGKRLDHARAALAMCKNIDDNVGRVLRRLDELEMDDNTIVIYFSDNGPNGQRYNAGLKGIKGSTNEGGIRSPLFVRWPAQVSAGHQVHEVAGAIDLYPTLAEACQVPPRNRKEFDGRSYADELTGKPTKPLLPRYLFTHWKDRSTVRWSKFRLDHQFNLYDLGKDPGQQNPLTDEIEVKQRLIRELKEFGREVVSKLKPKRVSAFTIGHPGMKFTQLPARDARATGQIRRSNRYPNCSYFTNWRSKEDVISWPVEVVKSGKFRVQLYYCLPVNGAGTQIELAIGDSKLSTTISQPHASPLIGAEHDRTQRAESLVKEFKPLDLGTMELSQGTGELILRTVEMPGEESIELRLLMFENVE